MMPRSLYAKLSLTLATLLLIVGAIWLTVSWFGVQNHLAEVNQTFNRSLAKSLVDSEGIVSDGVVNEPAIKDLFDRYMEINPSIEIYLLDMQGKIKNFSADPGKVVRKHVSLAPVKQFLQGATSYPIVGDDPRSTTRQKVFSVAPLPDVRNTTGYLYVVLHGEEFDSVERALKERYILRLGLWALAVALAVGMVLGLFLFRRLTHRLIKLVDTMRAFRSSDFELGYDNRDIVKKFNGDEIDELNHTFSLMGRRIADQFQSLENNDAKRREFIAHISHDLRTPIASITGFLETLQLKRGQLNAKEHDDYVDTALRQSKHLGSLINRLFELARLDTVKTQLKREPFSLLELVQDVAHQIHPLAAKRERVIRIKAKPPLPQVLGDISLIERALQNLITNAIDHGNGSVITILVADKTHTLRVIVHNDGEPIDKTLLKSVFEPFVTGSKERRQEHAGLGLAIVKRILDLHGTVIGANSNAGKGTWFTFELPKAAHEQRG